MENITLQEMTEIVRKFCEEREWDLFHNPKDLAIGISTEANELLDIFRFKSEEEMKCMFENPYKRTAIEEELADTLFFVLRFAQMNGINLSEALKRKIQKNNEKYPVSKSRGSNLKYTEI